MSLIALLLATPVIASFAGSMEVETPVSALEPAAVDFAGVGAGLRSTYTTIPGQSVSTRIVAEDFEDAMAMLGTISMDDFNEHYHYFRFDALSLIGTPKEQCGPRGRASPELSGLPSIVRAFASEADEFFVGRPELLSMFYEMADALRYSDSHKDLLIKTSSAVYVTPMVNLRKHFYSLASRFISVYHGTAELANPTRTTSVFRKMAQLLKYCSVLLTRDHIQQHAYYLRFRACRTVGLAEGVPEGFEMPLITSLGYFIKRLHARARRGQSIAIFAKPATNEACERLVQTHNTLARQFQSINDIADRALLPLLLRAIQDYLEAVTLVIQSTISRPSQP
jgi:hypothetical protein